MANDRTVRRLSALEQSGSSARVLNLLKIHRDLGLDAMAKMQDPFFENRILNNAIILKHKLRPSERVLFKSPPQSATKILLPIDPVDLRLGARMIFVDQIDFERTMIEGLGDDMKAGGRDRQLLKIINELPTMDPFLMREHLRSNGFEIPARYFTISDGDIEKMFEFVSQEVSALVNLTTGTVGNGHGHVSKLVEKLLSNSPDSGFEPLRETLKLTEEEYVAGVFAWRGFLYYKWVLSEFLLSFGKLSYDLAKIRGVGSANFESMTYVSEAKIRINRGISSYIAEVEKTIMTYSSAYDCLTRERNPSPFKTFLLTAPGMFTRLGELVGALQHIASFWAYRFPDSRVRSIGHDDLLDMFMDFEDSLALEAA